MIQKNQIQKKKSVMQTEKITDTSGLVKKKDYNAKITEIECKTPSISCLITSVALIVVCRLKIRYLMLVIQSSKQIMTQNFRH